MDRLSSRPQRHSRPAQPAPTSASTDESFSEMAAATANRPGVVGKLLVLSLIIVSIAVTAFVGYAIVNGIGSQSYIDKDNYQAVFLSDGQIYFGKLTNTDKDYATLEDIYYLQVQNNNSDQQPVQQGESTAAQITLVKLGNEIHGPKDEMIINRDQILFWENLKTDGQVADAIARYKKDGSTQDTTKTDTTQDTTTTDTAPAETSEN